MSFFDRLAVHRDFALPAFELAPLIFESECTDADELLLGDVVASLGALPDPAAPTAAAPTAGELHQSIELHLRLAESHSAQADSVNELRHALAQLRRSAG